LRHADRRQRKRGGEQLENLVAGGNVPFGIQREKRAKPALVVVIVHIVGNVAGEAREYQARDSGAEHRSNSSAIKNAPGIGHRQFDRTLARR